MEWSRSYSRQFTTVGTFTTIHAFHPAHRKRCMNYMELRLEGTNIN
jgi:hypothetical protein